MLLLVINLHIILVINLHVIIVINLHVILVIKFTYTSKNNDFFNIIILKKS